MKHFLSCFLGLATLKLDGKEQFHNALLVKCKHTIALDLLITY